MDLPVRFRGRSRGEGSRGEGEGGSKIRFGSTISAQAYIYDVNTLHTRNKNTIHSHERKA